MELFKSKRKAENEPRPREEGEEEEVFLKRSKLEVLAGLELTAKMRVSESCRKAVSFRFVSSRLVSSIFSSLLFSFRLALKRNTTFAFFARLHISKDAQNDVVSVVVVERRASKCKPRTSSRLTSPRSTSDSTLSVRVQVVELKFEIESPIRTLQLLKMAAKRLLLLPST